MKNNYGYFGVDGTSNHFVNVGAEADAATRFQFKSFSVNGSMVETLATVPTDPSDASTMRVLHVPAGDDCTGPGANQPIEALPFATDPSSQEPVVVALDLYWRQPVPGANYPEEIFGSGELRLTAADGGQFSLPGVDANTTELTIADDGTVDSFETTMSSGDTITAPGGGLLGHVVDSWSFGGAGSVNVSYSRGADAPSNCQNVPLQDSKKYLCLDYSTGGNISFGGLSCSSGDNDTTTVLVIQPGTSTVYLYTNAIAATTSDPFLQNVQSAALGISARNAIPFTPAVSGLYTRGEDPAFLGALYLAAELGLDSEAQGLPDWLEITVNGDLTVRFDPDLSSGDPAQFLPWNVVDRIGINAGVSGTIELTDGLSFEIPNAVAGTGIVNLGGGTEWASLSLQLSFNEVELPFGVELPNLQSSYIRANAYMDNDPNDGHPSHAAFAIHGGQLPGWNGAQLDASIYAGEDALKIDGLMKAGGQRVRLVGFANAQQAWLKGNLKVGFGGKASAGGVGTWWKLQGDLDLEIDIAGADWSIGLAGKLRACGGGKLGGRRTSKCTSVNAEVTLMDDGIKVCGDIPFINKKKCDRLKWGL